jgi:hypothetical protein
MIRKYAIIVFMVILSSCETSLVDDTAVLRLYGDALEDIGTSIAASDDGYLIGGLFTEVVRDGDYIQTEGSLKKLGIIKIDKDGKELSKFSFGGDKAAVGSKVIVLSDNSIASVGYIENGVPNLKDIFVVTVSADGTATKEMVYPSAGNQVGIDIIKTDEGFMVLGSTDVARGVKGDSLGNAAGKKDVYLLRISNDLQEIGSVAYGFIGNDVPSAIKEDKNEGFIVAGTTDNSMPDQKLNNVFIFHANQFGKVAGDGIKITGTTDDEYASDIEVLDDGYLIAGSVGGEGTEQSVLLIKMSDNIQNDPVYTRKFKVKNAGSTATSFSVKAISKYSDGEFVLAGQAGSGASAKMLIFVADSEGNQVAGKEMITTATGTQAAYDVISDDAGNIMAVGKNSFENNSMISFMKIRF